MVGRAVWSGLRPSFALATGHRDMGCLMRLSMRRQRRFPLSELYDPDGGLQSPRERIREFCGPVV